MSGPRRQCHPLPPFHPPTSKECQPPAWGGGPFRSPLPKLGLGRVKPGMLRQWGWGGEGSTTSPPHPSSWLSQPLAPPLPRTARDLAGPGCNPVVWHLGHCPGRQPGQQDELSPARGWLNGEQTLTPRTSQRRWPGFRQQLPVLEGDLGSSGPAHRTPGLAYHHVMTLHF